jgi:hypothetical protein
MQRTLSHLAGFFRRACLLDKISQLRMGRFFRAKANPRFMRPGFLEPLEDRLVPAILAEYPDSDVDADTSNYVLNLSASGSSSLYISTDSTGNIQWSDNGTAWKNKSSEGLVRKAGEGRDLLVQVFYFDTIYIGKFVGSGKNIAFQTSPVSATPLNLLALGSSDLYVPTDIIVNGDIYTNGGNLAIKHPVTGGLESIKINAGATISTRNIGAPAYEVSTDLAALHANENGSSSGNSGSIEFKAQNSDPYNPLFNIGFNHPNITVDAGAKILANVAKTDIYKGGDVSLQARNFNLSINGLFFNDLAVAKREANVTISSGAIVRGDSVEINSYAGDLPLIETIAQAAFGEDTTASEWATGLAQNGLDALSEQLGAALPISVVIKIAQSNLDIGANVEITAADGITINSEAKADAQAEAEAIHTKFLGAGFGFAWAGTTTNLTVGAGAKITAGGDIEIKGAGGATAEGIASYGAEEDEKDKNGTVTPATQSKYRVVGSVARTQQTIRTTVSAGSVITANGNVSISSEGETENSNETGAEGDKSGNAGSLTFNFALKDVDIITSVSGTVISNATPVGEVPLTFNPAAAVNTETDEILAEDHGFETGDPIRYSAGTGGIVDGLDDGVTYYAIRVDNDRIKLAESKDNAMANAAIDIPNVPYLQASATATSRASNAITTSAEHGFNSGETLLYRKDSAAASIGLTDNTRYYVVPTSTTAFNLYNINSAISAAASDIDITNNIVKKSGATNGAAMAYKAGDTAIGGLTDATVYYVVNADANGFKLAATVGGAPIDLLSVGAGTQSFLPIVAITGSGSIGNTGHKLYGHILNLTNIDDAQEVIEGNPGWDSGDTVTLNGAGSNGAAGLANGTSYRVIAAPGGDGKFWLASASTTLTASQNLADNASAAYATTVGLANIASIDATANTITLADDHPFVLGDKIKLTLESGTGTIGGLDADAEYFVITVAGSTRTIKLAKSEEDAKATTPVVIDLTTSSIAGAEWLLTRTTDNGDSDYAVQVEGFADAYDTVKLNVIGLDLDPKITFTTTSSTVATVPFAVDATNRLIYLTGTPASVGLANGAAVTYKQGLNLALGNLQDGDTAYAAIDPSSTLDYKVTGLADGVFTTEVAHPFTTGDALIFTSGNGSVSGLTNGTIYYVISTGLRQFKLAATEENALDGTPALAPTGTVGSTTSFRANQFRVWLTSSAGNATVVSGAAQVAVDEILVSMRATPDGYESDTPARMAVAAALGASDTATVSTVTAGSDKITFESAHPFQTGDRVYYTIDNLSADASAIPGLSTGAAYFVIRLSATEIKLAATREDAFATTPVVVDITSAPTNPYGHVFGVSKPSGGAVTAADTSTDILTTASPHGYATGDTVVYSRPYGTADIGSMKSGASYKAIVASPTTLSVVKEFVDIKGLDSSVDTLTIPNGFTFSPLDTVTYRLAGSGSSIGGLTNGTNYLVVPVDGTTVSLAQTASITITSVTITPDLATFTSVAHGLGNGDKVVYSGNGTIDGLSAGFAYVVVNKTNDTFQLATDSSGDASKIITVISAPSASYQFHKVVNLTGSTSFGNTIRFSLHTPKIDVTAPALAASSADATANTITFGSSHGLSDFDTVVYKSSGTAIPGLESGLPYTVVVNTSTSIRLADQNQLVRASAVDLSANTIATSSDLVLTNGQAVVYRNSGTTPIGGLTSGAIYFVIAVDTTAKTFQLAATSGGSALTLSSEGEGTQLFLPIVDLTGDLSGTGGATHQFGSRWVLQPSQTDSTAVAGATPATGKITYLSAHGLAEGQRVVYQLRDGKEIGGLNDGDSYYVIVRSDTEVSVAKSYVDALAGTAITLTSAGDKGVHRLVPEREMVLDLTISETAMTGTGHTLTPVPEGVTITSSVASVAKSKNDTSKLPTHKRSKATSATAGAAAATKAASALTSTITGNTSGASGAASSKTGGTSTKTSIAGAVTVQILNISVDTIIRRDAKIMSTGDMEISASAQVKANASAEATNTDTSAGKTGSSVSAVVTVATFDVSARALVEQGADLDAGGAMAVKSSVSYPFRLPLRGGAPEDEEDAEGLADAKSDFAGDPKGTLDGFNDGSLGLKSLLFNNWSRTASRSEKVGVAGVLQVFTYQNNSQAILGWRDPAADPSVYATARTDVNKDAAYTTAEQTVEVFAANKMDNIRMGGIFSINLSAASIKKAQRTKEKSGLSGKNGNSAGKGGVGGTITVLTANNTAQALIGKGVDVATSADSDGLSVAAKTRVFELNMAASGGTAGKFGFSGTAVYTQFNNSTKANIASGATYVGGPIDILAQDVLNNITLVGSLQRGQATGIGVSLAINDVTRNTEASIGERSVPTLTSSIEATGDISIKSINKGVIVGAAIAAAIIAPQPPDTPTAPAAGSTAANQTSNSNTTTSSTASSGGSGIGVSGAVALNGYGDFSTPAGLEDNAISFIRTQGTIKSTEAIDLTASNSSIVVALAGAAAMSNNPGTKATGLAGAVSVTTMGGTTEATVSQATVEATNLSLLADRTGIIIALAAGVAGAQADPNGKAVAGSVTVNEITNTTRAALLEGATFTLTKAVDVAAVNNTLLVSVAGSVAMGGKYGFGAAVAANKISDTTRAYGDSVTISTSTGSVGFKATSDNPGPGRARIVSIAGAVGVSTKGSAVSGMVAVNNIANTTEAYLKSSTLTGPSSIQPGEGVSLVATDNSSLISLGLTVSVAGQKAGLGAGVGYSAISNTTRAYLDDVTGTNTTIRNLGGLEVKATSNNLIVGIAVGAALSTGSSALAGNASVNIISNTTEAFATKSTFYGSKDIVFSATDSSTVAGVAGSVAISTKGTAVGAAVAYNEIRNKVRAYIEGSTINTSAGGVSVIADAPALLVGIAVGGSGSTNSTAVAGSLAINFIRNEILAEIRNSGATVSQVVAGGNIIVTASDKSRIIGITGSVAISATGAGIGIALATNDILNTTTGRITGSTVTSTGGLVAVGAGFDAPLTATSPGAIYAGGMSTAVELPTINGKNLNEAQIVH